MTRLTPQMREQLLAQTGSSARGLARMERRAEKYPGQAWAADASEGIPVRHSYANRRLRRAAASRQRGSK